MAAFIYDSGFPMTHFEKVGNILQLMDLEGVLTSGIRGVELAKGKFVQKSLDEAVVLVVGFCRFRAVEDKEGVGFGVCI